MNKIILYDNITNGHHKKYNNEIYLNSKSENWFFVDNFSEEKNIVGNKINVEFQKYTNVKKALKENDNIHFLYLDNMILSLFILSFSKKYKSKNISGTLHWAPGNRIKDYMLKFLLNKKKLNIVCHLNSIKEKYTALSNNVVVIKYPHFAFEKAESNENINLMINEKMSQKLTSEDENLKILMFGATAHYKGIDIVIESLSYIEKNIDLFIVGKEEFIKAQDFDQLKPINKKVALYHQLSFIDDITADFLFQNIDYVLVPYKKYFSGQSGPIVDALAYKKRVIVSDIEAFKDYKIDEPENIIFFEAENSHDLAEKINNLTKSYKFVESENIYSLTNFTDEYIKYFDAKIKQGNEVE